ncbi:MAG: hypothetical protein AAF485_13010 [Chloroflexota bacterium]
MSCPAGQTDRVVKPDDDFEVTLYWQTSQPISENYTAFVHLLDPEGNRVAQHDSWPANGDAPTKAWPINQPIADLHDIKIPPTLAAGVYQVWIGMYDSQTGERILLASDQVLFGGNWLQLTQIKVE